MGFGNGLNQGQFGTGNRVNRTVDGAVNRFKGHLKCVQVSFRTIVACHCGRKVQEFGGEL